MNERSKYILLKNVKVDEDSENEPIEVPQGEILEELAGICDIWSGNVALFYTHQQIKLTCPTKDVAKLSDLDAEDLIRIRSLEKRLNDFQARNRFEEPPRKGRQVFVAVNGREFKGIVRVVFDDNVQRLFGVQLFDEVGLEEHCIQHGTFKNCDLDVLCHLPNGGIGVLVSLEKLRPRNERKEALPKHHTRAPRGAVKNEKKYLDNRDGILGLATLASQNFIKLQSVLVSEQAAHEETRKELSCKEKLCKELDSKSKDLEQRLSYAEKAREEAEKQLQSCEEKVRCLETDLKQELQRGTTCVEKSKEEIEKQLQIVQEENKELKVTLATVQKRLKESDNKCEWILDRKDIHLTEETLGSGTFGTVVEGMFRGTKVAVKKVSVKPRITEYNIDKFRREMKMAARCRHPCMLQFIGATSDYPPLLVTEILDTSLKKVLNERKLELVVIITIARDVAKGLNYLHLNRPDPIVHRDISSGNVLLWKHGQSWRGKISDYGNAVMMSYAGTGSGGALPYLAPEMDNQRFLTKSDVYSYGVLLLEMCLRREPSCYDEREELVCMVEDGRLRSLARCCLQQDPKDRPTMEKVLAELTTASETN